MPPNPLSSTPSEVTVIGAGIVGLSTGLALQRKGMAVTVVDRGVPGHGASYGHAGGIAVSWVSPQGLPGIVKKLPRWVLDPLGPIAVRWPYLPRLLPWFLRLWRHSLGSEPARISDTLAGLMGQAWPAWDRVLKLIDMESSVHHRGGLTAYLSSADLEHDHVPWDMRRAKGFAPRVVDDAEMRSIEPALSPAYRAGVFEPEAKWCDAPLEVIGAMVEKFLGAGGSMVRAEVHQVVRHGRTVVSLETSAGPIETESIVIATGAWSHRLTSQVGRRVPLESERGYHVDLPDPGVELNQILSLAPHKLVVTPMRFGLRVSGTAEFSGIDSTPDFGRADALVTHAWSALPGLRATRGSRWAGSRPILPDSLPVIDRDPEITNVFYAFGHSHIGFTLGPVTGEMVADLVAGDDPIVPTLGLEIDRFGRGRPNRELRRT